MLPRHLTRIAHIASRGGRVGVLTSSVQKYVHNVRSVPMHNFLIFVSGASTRQCWHQGLIQYQLLGIHPVTDVQ